MLPDSSSEGSIGSEAIIVGDHVNREHMARTSAITRSRIIWIINLSAWAGKNGSSWSGARLVVIPVARSGLQRLADHAFLQHRFQHHLDNLLEAIEGEWFGEIVIGAARCCQPIHITDDVTTHQNNCN